MNENPTTRKQSIWLGATMKQLQGQLVVRAGLGPVDPVSKFTVGMKKRCIIPLERRIGQIKGGGPLGLHDLFISLEPGKIKFTFPKLP